MSGLFTNTAIHAAENGYIPDSLIQAGIKYLCRQRLRDEQKGGTTQILERQNNFIEQLKKSPIALVPEKANEQHYEVPPHFFELVLGPKLKYSSGLRDKKHDTLHLSELNMLSTTIQRAEIQDGMDILELGCGWGSLTLYMARKFPHARILGVSNSKDQKIYIDNKCKEEHITNVHIQTCDMNNFTPHKTFDRVISIEMFEHMRNYKALLHMISTALKDNGKLFVHIFSHISLMYAFEDNGPQDWMAREFFSGGIMPSHTLLEKFQEDLILSKSRRASGTHYKKTSYARLHNMDKNKQEILSLFEKTYGKDAHIWFYRRRIFFMACGEMFGLDKGDQRGVSHYLFAKRG